MTGSTTPTGQLTIAVIGAGGKMGMRVSDNLQRSTHAVYYSENSPAGRQRTRDAGREVTDTPTAVADAHEILDGQTRQRRRFVRPQVGTRDAQLCGLVRPESERVDVVEGPVVAGRELIDDVVPEDMGV